MDSRADKQKFLEQYHTAFMIPKRLEFQGQNEDLLHLMPQPSPPSITHIVELELQKDLSTEMDSRLQQLEHRVNNLRMESDEIWKTLETAEVNLLEILNTKDYDVSGMFTGTGGVGSDNNSIHNFQMPTYHPIQPKIHETPAVLIAQNNQKMRNDKQEIEEFYLTKIREFLLCTSRIARLDSKAEYLRNALTKDSAIHASSLVKSNVPKRKRIGRMNITGRPKLFGGSLEEYIEATGEDIPLVLRSCIRVINLFGLHHQGIFRVSGSQVEISNFREWFERGDDPLADTTDASDINSIAGVLKLYLRELREPLFPIIYFEHFIQLARKL
jgi:SLIT-ROBO Rho GTPase activating protein